MKVLITKSDGTPTKSKVHALQFLEKLGISKDCLIQENGQFFYDTDEYPANDQGESVKLSDGSGVATGVIETPTIKSVTWEVPVFDKNNEKTKLYIPGTDVVATINGKHPAGQLKPRNSFELSIGSENFIMSLDLVHKIFVTREV